MTRMYGEMTVANENGLAEFDQDQQDANFENFEADVKTRLDKQLQVAIGILEAPDDDAEKQFDRKMYEITAGMTPKESLAVSRRLVEMCKASRGK